MRAIILPRVRNTLYRVKIYAKLKGNFKILEIKNSNDNNLFSEMNASLAANMYTVRDNSNTIIAANLAKYVEDTLSKVWQALSFLNDHTDDGFS